MRFVLQAFNVLKYENIQHYDSHMDSFDPKDFDLKNFGGSQRIATVLVYLSDVIEGGETVFKKEGFDGADRPVTDWRNCNDGSFKYKPRQGDAVLFWGVYPNGEIDPHSLHGGCPVGWDIHLCGSLNCAFPSRHSAHQAFDFLLVFQVKNGTKWAMTKWLRSKGGRPAWA